MASETTRVRLRELACQAALEVNAAPTPDRERLYDFFRDTFMHEVSLSSHLRSSDEAIYVRALAQITAFDGHRSAHGHGHDL